MEQDEPNPVVAVAPIEVGAVVNSKTNHTVVPNQDGNNAPVAVAPNPDETMHLLQLHPIKMKPR